MTTGIPSVRLVHHAPPGGCACAADCSGIGSPRCPQRPPPPPCRVHPRKLSSATCQGQHCPRDMPGACSARPRTSIRLGCRFSGNMGSRGLANNSRE
eukprot:9473464-Pyramimonas_sp.AAC.1